MRPATALAIVALSGCASAPMTIIKGRVVPCPVALPFGDCPDAAAEPFEDGLTLYAFYKSHFETWKAHRGCRRLVDAIRQLHKDCSEEKEK